MRVVILLHDGYLARDGSKYASGDIAELSDEVALKLIGHGIAGPAPAPERETTAKAKPPKNAAKASGKTLTKRDFPAGGDA